jgi:cysteinyl-tRNA synthetase
MRIYNSLSKQIEDFKPIEPDFVKMYCCGPTVYKDQQIGNWRTFCLSDFLHRALKLNGYKVDFIMNMTDVGHLFEAGSDPEGGEDKIEQQSLEEGKTAKDIVEMYAKSFLEEFKEMNLLEPRKFTKATEYIDEQIDLVATLEERGFTYETSDGIYFDTSKFEKYGELSGLTIENIKEGARIDPNPEKKNPTDFALWKFSPKDKKRQQEWQSPWGVGFPGWHLECSSMIMTELGDTIDIHVGGEDLKMIHHQNEIAQSECATGQKLVNYWVHGAFLTVDGGKMSKSLGNYRGPLNFTWEAMQNSQNSLKRIYELVASYVYNPKAEISDKFLKKFREKIDEDLNIPEALAVFWELIKSSIPEESKLNTILKLDEFLGLKLQEHIGVEIPKNVLELAKMRGEYRKNGIWDKADVLRRQISDLGYVVEDLPTGEYKVKKKF